MKIWTTEQEAENLKRRFANENRAEFARTHHVPGGQAMIYQHVTGRRPISLEAALAYASGFKCRLEEISPRLALETKQASAKLGAPDLSEDDFAVPDDGSFEIIPQLDVEASCGHGKFQDYVQVKGGLVFKSETLRQWGINPSNGRIIYASGQSMEPTIQHGRVVLINTSETEPADNKVFLICDSDGGIVLKRLVREYDSALGDMVWKMRSDSPNKREFPDKPLPGGEHVTIVGRAVWNDSVL